MALILSNLSRIIQQDYKAALVVPHENQWWEQEAYYDDGNDYD